MYDPLAQARYGDLTAEQNYADDGRCDEDKAYFTSVFSGISECTTLPMPDVTGNDIEYYAELSQVLDIDTQALAMLCEKHNTTESSIFTAAFGLTLSKFTGSDEALFSTASHDSNDRSTERTFTMLDKMFPVYQSMQGHTTIAELILNTEKQLSETRKHLHFPYSEICTQIGLNIETAFLYHGNLPIHSLLLDEKSLGCRDLAANSQGLKFLCQQSIENGNHVLKCEYPGNLFSREFIMEFCTSFNAVVSEMLVKERLDGIESCSARQLSKLESFHSAAYPAYATEGETLVSLFRGMVKTYPENTALVFREKRFTYRELERSQIFSPYTSRKLSERDTLDDGRRYCIGMDR